MEILEFDDVEKVMSEFKSTKGIIVDLRNYPQIIPFVLARRFIKSDTIFARLTEPDLSYPGKYKWKKSTISPMKNKFYKGKVILLVNEETQSAGEYSAMMLQTGANVLTVGSQTAGADGDISMIEFIKFSAYISGIGVFYPDQSETQRKGIKVDIEVNRTIEGIRSGKDEVLEKAVEIIDKL